jgi:hypothetical protein
MALTDLLDPDLILNIIAIGVVAVWGYFALRLIAVTRKGSLEGSWKNSANGALSIGLGIFFEFAKNELGANWAGELGSGLITLGGIFMALAMRNQYVVWSSITASSDSAIILESFAKSNLKSAVSDEKAHVQTSKDTKLARLRGKKMILEFDPATDYEGYVSSLVKESSDLGSTAILFTKPGSTLSALEGTKLVYLSISEQGMKLNPDGALSVSITNPSLILDAFKSVLAANPDATLIIDNLTELTLSLGFAKTYSLLQQIGEKMIKSKSLLVLLLNPGAHDEKVVSAFEGYGNVIIRFDSTGTHSKKGGELLTYA